MSGPWRGRLLVVAVILLAGFPAWINVAKKLETLPERVERMKGAATVVQQKGQSVARVKLLPPATGIAPAITGEDAASHIDSNFQSAHNGIHDCLQKWKAEEPEFAGTTTVEVTVGPAGVTQLALLGHHVVPSTAGRCMQSLLWAMPWPAADPPLVSTREYSLSKPPAAPPNVAEDTTPAERSPPE